MPGYLKLLLSVLVATVALAVHVVQGQAGHDFDSWLVLGLAAFTILAVWLFPEPRPHFRKDDR